MGEKYVCQSNAVWIYVYVHICESILAVWGNLNAHT